MFSILAYFLPVFFMDKQHSETFPLMPVEMFVMHFMGPTNSPHIGTIAAGKPFHPLVYDHVMHQEISKSIGHDTKTDRLHPPQMIERTEIDKQHTGDRKNHKKCIVL